MRGMKSAWRIAIVSCAFGVACSDATPKPDAPSPPAREAVRERAGVEAPRRDTAPPDRNVVLIISDDHGYADYGFMGSEHVQTPNLDRLSERGVVYTHAFATASLCKPSLRTLLTGLEPLQWRARLEDARRRGLLTGDTPEIEAFVTLPELLSARGYVSFKAGKFWETSPEAAGFDGGTVDTRDGPFSHSEFGRPSIEEALAFIREPRDEPFFLWFAPTLPHGPFDAGPAYRDRYRELALPPPFIDYYANVTRFDDKVGELLRALDDEGLRERTLILFAADNGKLPSDLMTRRSEEKRAKGTAYDAGIRTPLILALPGAPPRRSDELVSLSDIVPTVLDYAGAARPADLPGRSLLPSREADSRAPRDRLIGWLPSVRPLQEASSGDGIVAPPNGAYFVRTPRWHYIWAPEVDIERLYDVAGDPHETIDRVAEQPALAADFESAIELWRSDMLSRAGLDATPGS